VSIAFRSCSKVVSFVGSFALKAGIARRILATLTLV
jgi:hypothetical protein